MCHILHSADFCVETLDALTSAIQKDMKKELSDKVRGRRGEGRKEPAATCCGGASPLGVSTARKARAILCEPCASSIAGKSEARSSGSATCAGGRGCCPGVRRWT